ncbi:sugar phosphate isomerase/epimerase family protein [Anaerobaca lacustris]|uniref:Sugar phosphate isomerase/epimerase family protein n=1 Tax=Anaerobaca lacustris TaxID=3044600 RepID=A0AAW6U447_9BACT|nr:sugar phosphate isomerase/epimerase family protein [Sedimentisphaerales bacterium M17dextr]
MAMKPAQKAVRTDHDYRTVPLKRRQFLWKTGALALGAGLGSRLTALAEAAKPGQPNATKLGWKMSVQQYTYRRFTLFEALEKAAAVGLRYFEVRSNLKMGPTWPGKDANEAMPEDARKEFKARIADLGLAIPSVFADFHGGLGQAKRLFEFWKGFGTEVIVAEPPEGSFDMLEKLCEEYTMRLALHNHQKGQSKYWSPDIVLEVCANRSERIGACADGGQWARSGLDPVECLRKLQGRIITFHLKDVLKKGDLNSRNTVIGEGQADCANTLKELKRLGYQGLITIDFEHDTPALQEDMARNVAFVDEQARQLLAQ